MIKPVNGHLLIDPIERDAFMLSQRETYEEIGVVLSNGRGFWGWLLGLGPKVGSKVYFDSWLAAKYPKEGTDSFYWLVQWKDVRAVE